jgi:hypothetical protein
MSTELDALMLANALEVSDKHPELINVNNRAAAELRRLHAENKRLETLCYDYLGELTAMRAVEHMRKQRKPLTDEEIELLAVKHAPPTDPDFGDDDWIEFARAIERAHGIGGEA